MAKFKKAVFMFGLAVGLTASVSAWAYPDEDNCIAMKEECEAGDQQQCDNFRLMDCTQTLHPLKPQWGCPWYAPNCTGR